MRNYVYFIGGVSGSGKSSLVPVLRKKLDNSSFDIHDFDERGVPEGITPEWRLETTKYWLKKAKENVSETCNTIICGFVHPDEIHKLNYKNLPLKFCLLDVSKNKLADRLHHKFNTKKKLKNLDQVLHMSVEENITTNTKLLEEFRKEFGKYSALVIDTTNLTSEQIANKFVNFYELATK